MRAWVLRDFGFWHRCTVDVVEPDRVAVSFDNMDELSVVPEDVQPLELKPKDIVFVGYWESCPSGYPAFVLQVRGEVADILLPAGLYRKEERQTHFLRFLRFYDEAFLHRWNVGDEVFAYRATQFQPPLFLLFPARVLKVHHEVCVQLDFHDGEMAFVPTSLIEVPPLDVGDTVYTCVSYASHGTNPDERWGPCRILERDGNRFVLLDADGRRFESKRDQIAILPRGYRMPDGKLERAPTDPLLGDPWTRAEASSDSVHIVRTDNWLDADRNPITKADVDGLLMRDRELAWKGSDGIRVGLAGGDRPGLILWNGKPCFWWNRNEIRCEGPNAKQLAKMIEIAIELDANVVGDDGREYH
jgi:hypothetical protein